MLKKKKKPKILSHENPGEAQKEKWYMKKKKKDMPSGGDQGYEFDRSEKQIEGLYKGSK